MALLGAGLAARLALVADAASDHRFAGVVPDDAFYYFRIAENLLAGKGSTFDGVTPTNGYHPLWLGLLLPIFALPLGPAERVLAVMAATSLLWVLGGVLLATLAARVCRRPPATAAVLLLYLATPGGLRFSLDGLETALVVVLHLALLVALIAVPPDELARPRSAVAAGALAGLLFLARTDSIVVVAVAAAVALRLVPSTVDRRAWALRAGTTAALVVAPWLIWNLATFGAVVQSSGQALPFIRHAYAREVEMLSLAATVERSAVHLGRAVALLVTSAGLPLAAGGAVAFLSMLLIAVRLAARRPTGERSRLARLAPVFAAVGVLLLLHAAIRWTVRPWYLAVPLVVLLVLAVAVLEAAFSARGALALAALGLLATVPGQWREWRSGGPYPHQRGMWEDYARWDRELPGGVAVGITDAGIAGYRMRRHRVVNLDGVVDGEVLASYRAGRGLEHVLERDLTWVVTRLPYVHPVFMGPAGMHLRGAGPFASAGLQRYRVVSSLGEAVRRHEPEGLVELGTLAANPYLGPGWEVAAGDGPWRWSVGRRSVLYLPRRAGCGRLVLEVRRPRWLARQEIEVRLAGRRLAKAAVAAEWTSLELELPPAAAPRIDHVVLLAATAPRPATLGVSMDRRPLGIAARSLLWTPEPAGGSGAEAPPGK